MERYDYNEAILNDVKEYLDGESFEGYEDRERLEEELNDRLWTVDSITGNGSGSYTCNTWLAEEHLCHNFDLLCEALNSFDCDADYLQKGAEACDVTIRCYLLPWAIHEALNELWEED